MGSIGENKPDYDVLCIGAGLSGIYTAYRLRELGLKGRVLEAGSAEGGTWYWNRYPGARFDSESYSYQYFFDQDLMQEWHWQEHFAGQAEILAYINHVVEKFDLKKDMQFDTRIEKASFDEANRQWILIDQSGRQYSCRWLITAIGILTNPTLPNIPGVENFKGEAYHTARWPHSPVDFAGKRVAVLGTGATGIQTIQEVAKTAGHLTVLQRRPNWACPMHNGKIDTEEMERLRAWYPEMMRQCHDSYQGFLHPMEQRRTTDVSTEEREAIWEDLYNSRGFGIWFSNFWDINVDREANRQASEFIAKKIRLRVKDPETAEKLVPKDHGFATKRVPLETNYYEVYNQPNVRLVSLQETPIQRITEKGVQTSGEELEFDMIIYATGFDAVTGSFDAIDVQGLHNTRLKELWKAGPKTYLGMTVKDFPNM
jgi:cation diffusion facilitator CzcD-associated flavoprotein CzcO